MTGAVISIQTPGSSGQYEHFYRIPCEDAHADTLRKAITAWARKPSDYLIGNKRAKPTWKAKPVVRGDEDVIPGMEVNATVEKALA